MAARQLHIAPEHVTAFIQGGEQGFDQMFRDCYPALCWFARRLIQDAPAAEELAATAFLKTWQHRAGLDSAGAIRAYLYQVLRNDCYKWLRQQQRNSLAGSQLAALAPQSQESPAEAIIRAEVLRRLHAAIETLPGACRAVFGKLYIEGKSVAETAAELRISPSTVKTQKARGILSLRRRLGLE